MPNIQLVAVGRVEPAILDYLAMVLPESAGGRATLSRQTIDPREAFDPARQQFHSTWILTRLADLAGNHGERVVGVADVDLFVPIFTFVFGEAQLGGAAALFSAARLRQEFYGLPADEGLFYERCEKEALHELGHTLGLVHCPIHACVMHFANSIEEVDLRSAVWCPECDGKRSL